MADAEQAVRVSTARFAALAVDAWVEARRGWGVSDYADFLATKRRVLHDCGRVVEPDAIHPSLFGFQRAITAWALRKGRAAIFADCGLGNGVIGLSDLRSAVIDAHVAAGWVYHGDITIDKNPQAQAIRTHSKSLLFVQLEKDSTWSRPALADYVLVFRKPGDNAVPVRPVENGDLTRDDWIAWASPCWYDIRESATLNAAVARENEDERHICPLQLPLIQRCVRLWSNPGETVLSPFAGIGSEGVGALRYGRRFLGIELKPTYWATACENLRRAEREASLPSLFDPVGGPA